MEYRSQLDDAALATVTVRTRLTESDMQRLESHIERLRNALPGIRHTISTTARHVIAVGLDIIERDLVTPEEEKAARKDDAAPNATKRGDKVGQKPLVTWQVIVTEDKYREDLGQNRTFLELWDEHWRGRGKKLSPPAIRRQFDSALKVGVARYCKAIEMSLNNGWIGIFPDKLGKRGGDAFSAVDELRKAMEGEA